MHHKQRLLLELNRLGWFSLGVLNAVASDHGDFSVSLDDQVRELFFSHLGVGE